uniref:MORN repeat-containing protein n=1 Tax=Strongyloides venezuelensis TaxID=75913 RepID=A0A0K0G0E4_STRVS
MGETSHTKKAYQSNDSLFDAKFTGSGIKIVASKDEIGILNKKYAFGYDNEGTFYADSNKSYQYGFYDKGRFILFNNSSIDESKGTFGYLYKGTFYIHKTPPEYCYPKKYQFGYIDNAVFISLQKFQDNQYDLSQTIPERKHPKSKIPVSSDDDNQIVDLTKYIM